MEDIDSVPSHVQSARQEALLYVFEDNEAVIKMIIKGRSPTMRRVSRTHRVALDWLFDRINLDSKIQIKYVDTKNQLADILTKGNFTRDEWNHLLTLFNISHFSSTVCSAAMAKRIQQESGEERVTAKSRPMMNLTARMPTVVSSSTSSSPGKTWYEYQDPGKSVVVDDRSGQPDRSPAGYSKSDYDRSWSSQEWKNEVTTHDRSGKPDKTSWNVVQQVRPHHGDTLLDGGAQSVRYGGRLHERSGQSDSAFYQEVADSEIFVMGNDAAEFANKVKDQVRKRQKRMSNVAESGEEHSIIWEMFMATTMNAATFMGKNFMDNENSIKNSADLTLKMSDISEKLVSEQEEINNVEKIYWKNHSWKQLSLIGDETVINLQRTKVYVFSDSVLCLGKVHQHPESNEAWKKRIGWIVTDKRYRDYDGINREPTEFEWNIFPGFTTLQLCSKVTDLLSSLGEAPETFTGRILLMSMFNDISCDGKGNEEECVANAKVVSILAKKFGIGQWSFIGPGSEKKWYSMEEISPQGIWDHIADKMLLEFAESGCPIFRATTPLSRGNLKNKGHGKLSFHFTADYPTIETIFRIIVSANQLSLYGAVVNMCEEFETHQDRSGQPYVLMGQSIVLSGIKAEVPLANDIPSHQNLLLQRYEERIKLLSQENKVSKSCMDAGFIHVVEVGQYFMTKHTEEQFFPRACREYTLPRRDESSQPIGWIQGNPRIGPVLEITTSYLYGKHGIQIRIWSLRKDNSQSWVRISHGSNKFVIDSNYNNTEVPADVPEEQASQSIVKVFAARSKAKAKPQRREPVDLPSIIPMSERKWILNQENLFLCVRDFEESNQSSSALSNSTTRGRRSSSILEDQEFSSKSIFTNNLLVGWSLESMLVSRRRSEKEISVLY